MAWSDHTWKILRIFQRWFIFGEVCAETSHSPYTSMVQLIKSQIFKDYGNKNKTPFNYSYSFDYFL